MLSTSGLDVLRICPRLAPNALAQLQELLDLPENRYEEIQKTKMLGKALFRRTHLNAVGRLMTRKVDDIYTEDHSLVAEDVEELWREASLHALRLRRRTHPYTAKPLVDCLTDDTTAAFITLQLSNLHVLDIDIGDAKVTDARSSVSSISSWLYIRLGFGAMTDETALRQWLLKLAEEQVKQAALVMAEVVHRLDLPLSFSSFNRVSFVLNTDTRFPRLCGIVREPTKARQQYIRIPKPFLEVDGDTGSRVIFNETGGCSLEYASWLKY